MGSSAKKKKEKQKDFQKPKLKVGKARPKAANTTDTSFQAKGIILNQQLNVDAPAQSAQFAHHVSLLSSRSDTQRRDSLAYLAGQIASTPRGSSLPLTSSDLFAKLCPLILDGSLSVRTQLLKVFQSFPTDHTRDHVERILPYVRAGLTHLSRDVRGSAIDVLSFLIHDAGLALVSSPGGWYKTLECFMTVLCWRMDTIPTWSSNLGFLHGDVKSAARIMQVLAEFLQAGLITENDEQLGANPDALSFPLWGIQYHVIPKRSNPFGYLDLYGPQKDIENQILEDREDRLTVFNEHFRATLLAGIDAAKKEGGELGRASGVLRKTVDRAQQP